MQFILRVCERCWLSILRIYAYAMYSICQLLFFALHRIAWMPADGRSTVHNNIDLFLRFFLQDFVQSKCLAEKKSYEQNKIGFIHLFCNCSDCVDVSLNGIAATERVLSRKYNIHMNTKHYWERRGIETFCMYIRYQRQMVYFLCLGEIRRSSEDTNFEDQYKFVYLMKL